MHIRNLTQALNYGLDQKKVKRVIKINKKVWVKSYTDMNTKIRKKSRKRF